MNLLRALAACGLWALLTGCPSRTPDEKKPRKPDLGGEDQPITMSGAGSTWFSWLGPAWERIDAYSWKRPGTELGTLYRVEIQVEVENSADDYTDIYSITFPEKQDAVRTVAVWVSPDSLKRRFVFQADKDGLNLNLTAMADDPSKRFRLNKFFPVLASPRTNITYARKPNFQKVVVTNGQQPVCLSGTCAQGGCSTAATCTVDCTVNGATCAVTLKYRVD